MPKCILKSSLNSWLVLRPMIHVTCIFVSRSMIHVTCIFVEYQTGVIADHSFEAIPWPQLNGQFFKTRFSLLWSKCIFEAPLTDFYNLDRAYNTHVVYIFVRYQAGAIADHSLKRSRDFNKTINIYVHFHCYCPNVFSKLL